jgi:hypothetical protein
VPSSTFWRTMPTALRSSPGDLMGHTKVNSEHDAQDMS